VRVICPDVVGRGHSDRLSNPAHYQIPQYAADMMALLATTCDYLDRQLKRESTLVEKNIAALGNLLQLNPAERAILLYGTLARYQRELRGALV
jgi:hypothetical protein